MVLLFVDHASAGCLTPALFLMFQGYIYGLKGTSELPIEVTDCLAMHHCTAPSLQLNQSSASQFELHMQETMEPTDVIVNFGAWLRNTNSTCGASEGDTLCPHIPWLCNYLKGEHSFRTWWLTATPRVDDNMVVDQIPPSHHLNIPARCQLRPSQVLDRKVVIDILQPDPLRQNELWWDVVHLHADANHGFNRQLVSRMTEAVAKSPREMHQRGLWKQLFANGR